ncbi:MAG TPA: molybdopterin biosynthesis protein [Armatimonadota bacterium]|nr:molybdopterin biosynthesis protein [Armatimonadota bacterium]
MAREPAPAVVSLARAHELWRRALDEAEVGPVAAEMVDVIHARGRVTAAAIAAARSWPHYHAAAMDGIAVTAADTVGASESAPRRLGVPRDAEFINTGDALPAGRDAVVKIEEVAVCGSEVEITSAAAPWSNTRPAGEDLVVSETVLPPGHVIRPVDVAALIAGGVTQVAVRRRPRVAVIPTGSEVVEPGAPLAPGQIVDFDSHLLAGLLAARGCEAVRWNIIPDDREALGAAIAEAARGCDAVAMIAGASAGTRDYTARALADLGRVVVHGVAMRPGKPVILGLVGSAPFIGVPGYPVSAVICFEQFVEPLVTRWLGVAAPVQQVRNAVISRDLPSIAGSEEFVRVRLGEVGGRLVAVPLARGAGLITSLVRADGVVRIPALSEGLSEGEEAACALRVPEEALSATILVTGSHDLSIEALDAGLRRARPGMRLASTHVGSQAGLGALRGGYCHAAGTHLLDPDTGDYNVAHVRRLWEPGQVSLVTVALRQQGLVVAPGNPLGLQRWQDLARPGLRFINRQRGAGTRVLLDYELRRAGVAASAIEGYRREVYTHLAVAAAVQSGAADVGVGIAAAAHALGLGFVPLARERYELAVVTAELAREPLLALVTALNEEEFRRTLQSLGGYDVSATGAIRAA